MPGNPTRVAAGVGCSKVTLPCKAVPSTADWPRPRRAAAPSAAEFVHKFRMPTQPCRITGSTSPPSPQAGARAIRGYSVSAPALVPRAPSPRTRVATEARGWRSTFRRSIARLVPQPGQNTSSHGVPAISAARIVGDHSTSRLAASCSFQRSTALCLGARAALATCRFALMATSTPRVRTPIAAVPARNRPLNPAGGWRAAAADS
jgi:hypothetical protein